jgi:hypothetical protein
MPPRRQPKPAAAVESPVVTPTPGDVPRPDFSVLFPSVKPEYAGMIYDLAVQGIGDREIAQQLRVPIGRFRVELGRITMLAREHYPTHAVQRSMALYRGEPLPAALGGGSVLPTEAIEKIRQLALEGMPDKFIAIGASVKPEMLHEPAVRQMIEEARLLMTRRLVQHLLRAAMGNEHLLDAVADQLNDAKANGDPLTDTTLQAVLDLLSSERVAPNLGIAEKLLQRLGYFEAPMQAEIKVRVTFDPPPVRAGSEVQGEATVTSLGPVDDVDS